ncbi:NUDIX hydrolase [Nonomuraea sp. bgisy101]|uniref:NUDIX hydrolase n=1 Tax=Nonomuraea sp. bgisy101 TaxID=3413784 RepID=UPI003D7283E1
MKALSVLTVSAVARRNGEVLLVRQRNAGDAGSGWDLPGGMVEAGELADDAVLREIWEETGLRADMPSRLLCIAQFRNPDAPPPGMLTAMYFEVEGLQGEICCQDPDGDVLDAEWVSIAEAVIRLSAGRASHMRDPAVRCLTRPGPEVSFWTWPNGLAHEPRVIPPDD